MSLRLLWKRSFSTEAQRSILFAKHKLCEFGNKSNKYLANLVKARAGPQAIPLIKDNFGNKIYKDRDINNLFLEFYHRLYKSESDCDSMGLMDKCFSVIKLPQASDTQKELLNC